MKGGIGGAGKFVPGLGGAIIGGSGLLDILHEWRRQHGQVPGG